MPPKTQDTACHSDLRQRRFLPLHPLTPLEPFASLVSFFPLPDFLFVPSLTSSMFSGGCQSRAQIRSQPSRLKPLIKLSSNSCFSHCDILQRRQTSAHIQGGRVLCQHSPIDHVRRQLRPTLTTSMRLIRLSVSPVYRRRRQHLHHGTQRTGHSRYESGCLA